MDIVHVRRPAPLGGPVSSDEGGNMQRRSIGFALMLVLFLLAEGYSQEPFMGTWKLNKKESIIPAGAPRNNTVTYETGSSDVKVTVDGTDGEGKPVHSEWVGKFDGKDYSVSGDPNSEDRKSVG